MTKEIGVGIVGFGLSGSVFHAPLVSVTSGLKLVAVVSTRRDDVQRSYPTIDVVNDLDQVLNREDIQLIVVGLPNFLHFEVTSKALLAGKHVVVEKPFTTNVDEADRLIALARQQDRLLTVFHNRRWDADFLTIKSLLRRGDLGEVFHFEAHFDRYRPQVDSRWKETSIAGGGVLFDLGSHLIDQALNLFGIPDALFADLECQREQAQQPDYFHVLLRYGKRRVALHAGTLVSRQMPRYTIHGDKGSFWKFGMDVQEDQLKSGLSPLDLTFGMEPINQSGFINRVAADGTHIEDRIFSERGDYLAFYRNIVSAINTQSLAAVTCEEARDVIKAIELAHESSRARAWVEWF